jgi:hypothetical protein
MILSMPIWTSACGLPFVEVGGLLIDLATQSPSHYGRENISCHDLDSPRDLLLYYPSFT